MLVLTRKPGETIMLPDQDVSFTVLGVHGQMVRLGVTAPRETQVHRSEVWVRIQQANHDSRENKTHEADSYR